METIYLSPRAQVAVCTFFMKSPVYNLFYSLGKILYNLIYIHNDNANKAATDSLNTLVTSKFQFFFKE